MPSLTKVLIANRGEIACRIIRACNEFGIATVAVYSEADRNQPHVRMADEAYLIGPPPARESYLNLDRLIEVARESGASGVHPGYGFLAENAEAAEAFEDAGVIWIGPPVKAIRLMGDKLTARATVAEAGLPLVPGTGKTGRLSNDELIASAAGIGFPWGTVTVNLLGCFLFGLILTLSEERAVLSANTRLILLVGFMGALTTFSSFAGDTLGLLRNSQYLYAFANITLQNIAGLTLLWLGIVAGRLV